MQSWALPAPPPLPPVNPPAYYVTLTRLQCITMSSAGPFLDSGQVNPDECYLDFNGAKIWPASSEYIKMITGEVQTLNIPLPPVSILDNELVVELYESDWGPDDHLNDFKFHPNSDITYKHGDTWIKDKLSNLQPNTTYTMEGQKIDADALYTLDFKFTIQDNP